MATLFSRARMRGLRPHPSDADATFHAAPRVVSARHGERTVLLDPHGGYFGLDPVGGRIWELLESGTTRQALVDRLEAEYDAPRERLEADVARLLEELAAARLAVAR